MCKRFVVMFAMSILLVAGLLPPTAAGAAQTTYYVNPPGGSDGQGNNNASGNSESDAWLTIGYAVTSADPGDTIVVMDGTTIENVNVYKPLTIRSLHGFQHTKVEAEDASESGFTIGIVDMVTIEGFSIYGATEGSSAAITLNQASNCTITDNRCGWAESPITNRLGIYLLESSNNTVTNNLCNYIDKWGGIYLESNSNDNTVEGNSCNYNNDCGICLYSSRDNTIKNNTCENNGTGVWEPSEDLLGLGGIQLYGSGSRNNIISNNVCSNNIVGLSLGPDATTNTINENDLSSNTEHGILLGMDCNNNTVTGNVCSNNRIGIELWDNANNTIFLNDFHDNTINAASAESHNNWHSRSRIPYYYLSLEYTGFMGNYYDDYTGVDDGSENRTSGDGIGDTAIPYHSNPPNDSDGDTYPLMAKCENYQTTFPYAEFSATPTHGEEPTTIHFTDESLTRNIIDEWSWDFGDGSTSNEQDPTHLYTQVGSYTVSLTVTNRWNDQDTETKVNYIVVSDANPTADFSIDPLTGIEPLPIKCSDLSDSYDGIVSWLWDFGDGSTSDEQNPTHEYAQDGLYNISLTVLEYDGDTHTHTKQIDTSDTTPTADFSSEPSLIGEFLTVQFTDRSLSYDGIVSWAWNFGDNHAGDEQNPTHQYAAEGTYPVSLTVFEADGNTSTKEYHITVYSVFHANFAVARMAVVGQTIQFTNLSGGGTLPLTYEWDFDNDGIIDSTDRDPQHTYSTPGTHTISLTLTDSSSSPDTDVKTREITIIEALACGTALPGEETTIQAPDGTITLELPADAVTEETYFIIREKSIQEAPSTLDGFIIGDTYFSIETSNGLAEDVKVIVKCSSEDLDSTDRSATILSIARYNEETEEWDILSTQVDNGGETLTTATGQMGKFVVLAHEADTDPADESSSGWNLWIIVGLAGALLFLIVAIIIVLRRRNTQESTG